MKNITVKTTTELKIEAARYRAARRLAREVKQERKNKNRQVQCWVNNLVL